MKTISIQSQPDREPEFNEEDLLSSLFVLGFKPEIKHGTDDEGPYVNYYIDTDDLKDAWQKIKSNIITNQTIANSCIVICQGNNGWEDILFLHHYDEDVKLDEL